VRLDPGTGFDSTSQVAAKGPNERSGSGPLNADQPHYLTLSAAVPSVGAARADKLALFGLAALAEGGLALLTLTTLASLLAGIPQYLQPFTS